MKTDTVLMTEDLLIRPSVFDDMAVFYEWETQPAVTEFFSIHAGQTMEEVCQKYFDDLADPGALQFTICSAEDTVPIGRIVLADVIPGWKGEIWRIYIADPGLRGRGLGKQALLAIMRHMFESLDLQRVYLDFYTGNPAEYLYRSVGMQEEGVLRGNCRKDGVLHDVHLMSMLRNEWEERYC